MLEQFETAADSGLGPDLLVAPSNQIRNLAEAKLIDAIGLRLPEDVLARYATGTLETVRFAGQIYGLPITLNTMALYYDRRQVEQPPATLDALLAEAAQGKIVAISTNFRDAFWGVQGFGGQLFDEEGRILLDQGGFANWLAWLKDAREAPGTILDANRDALRSRFVDDGITYYVGSASELNAIMTALGEANVGVAVLPAGPTGSAGPLLTTQAALFSDVSSANQRKLALAVAQFMTNAEQAATLMRQAGHVPANSRVRVNPRLNPNIASFVAQARTAVPLVNIPQMDVVMEVGGDAYARVLEGVAEPGEVALEITNAINEFNGVASVTPEAMACDQVGVLRLAHMLEGEAAGVFERVLDSFRVDCPTVIIQVQQISPDTPVEQLTTANRAQYDLILAPPALIRALNQAGAATNITELVDAGLLQRFHPVAVDALRHDNNLFGLPLSLEVNALYYNQALVADPARTLDDLRTQSQQGVPVALDIRFAQAAWGIGAFGGQVFDAEMQLALDQGAFAGWLAWLKDARETAGIHLSTDGAALKTAFLRGETAYLVGGPGLFAELKAALGAENLGVAVLPACPNGEARPLLTAPGFVWLDPINARQQQLALAFVSYATNIESQTLWLRALHSPPANANVDLRFAPLLATFVEQARTAQLWPNTAAPDAMLEMGQQAYRAVLEENQDPAAAVEEVTRMINAVIGVDEGNE
jgi:arabinogalactan oligomer/maltooligosaccharide transport system substrate-binding protein